MGGAAGTVCGGRASGGRHVRGGARDPEPQRLPRLLPHRHHPPPRRTHHPRPPPLGPPRPAPLPPCPAHGSLAEGAG
eukprot:871597-Rhodomonas_salina.1